MFRIVLTTADLARIRIGESETPAIENVFAFEAFREEQEEGFHPWRRSVHRHLAQRDPRTGRVGQLMRYEADSEQLIELCTGTERSGTAFRAEMSTSQLQVLAAMRDFFRLAVAPHWSSVRTHLDAARDTMRDIMCRDGVEVLLDSLGPGIRWSAPALEISGFKSGELHLCGEGLVLSPSLFLARPGHVVVPGSGSNGKEAPQLFFPDRPHSDELVHLLGGSADGRVDRQPGQLESLAALMGRTRAAALQALKEGCTNTELAERLGVSSAAVSQHTAVLRAAGLISTRRNRSHAVHTVTRLGHQLLRGHGPGAQWVVPAALAMA
ncbi:ArsR/SmtB family transcription factor [Kitasatospora sp. NPDC101235]|uniref:ArsR/SmtB family transcription factor n=1 Tax=Kitasatospora sp. NPDC101235 TaxID=3364101 RepID=UPI003817AECC